MVNNHAYESCKGVTKSKTPPKLSETFLNYIYFVFGSPD